MTGDPLGMPVGIRTGRALNRVQEQIWASQRLHPHAPLANMAYRISIEGDLDPDRLRAAFDEVVRSADALRSVFTADGGVPGTRVLPDPPAETAVLPLDRELLDGWCADRISRPIDAAVCVYDSVLLRHGPTDWTWWLDIHHLATDAMSSALVVERTASVYGGEDLARAGPVAPTSEPSDRESRHRSRAIERWSAPRAGRSPFAPYGPTGPATTRSDRLPVELTSRQLTSLTESLDGPYGAISRELGLLALLATAVAVWIRRTDGRREATLGLPVHHRSGRGADQVVGPLMELFPLDVTIEDDDTFRTLHRRTLRSALDVLRHAVPGTSPDQDFPVVLNVLTARYGDFAGLSMRAEWVPSGHADPRHLVRLQVHDHTGDGPRLEIDLNHALGPARTRARIPGHLLSVLAAALEDPDASIGSVLLPAVDERVEIARLNDRPGLPDPQVPVDVQIAAVLRGDPERLALEEGSRRLSAAEVDAGAEAIAGWLADQGLGVGDRIGLRLPRGADAVVAVQGVLRAGAAFVMLDPGDPSHRHDLIIADASLALVIDELPALAGPANPPPAAQSEGRSLDDLAYVLYTSGSTGVPKGVPISHRGLAGYLAFALDAYVRPEAPPTAALHSSLVFDLTITTLLLPLMAGGSIVVFPGDPVDALAAVGRDRRIDFLKLTPSQLELYLQLGSDPAQIEVLVVGGEAFRRPLALAATRAGGPGLRIYNEYGPTEAVVGCMIHRFDAATDVGVDVPIGHSCPDSEVFILDAHGQLAPEGSWGELVVRRPGMATTYLGHPSPGPFGVIPGVGGPPLYRTGDRARIERPGVAVYGGRFDHQLKIGGVRFEPGEIEAALIDHPDIDNALVRIWQPGSARAGSIRCERCGLGTDVPGITIDPDGVCSSCHAYDRVRVQAEQWFRTPSDLRERLDAARRRRRGDHDCLHLLSGGKDSTYALYQLVAQGWRVHALTLDNGYISDGAKENIRRTVADLGVSHEFVTTDAMNAIFRDSLERYSNVCNGCYKTIYTLAVTRAHALGIPVIVTGLSRGQFFETRLVPHQFESGHFDADAIDAAVLEARKAYHRTQDAVTRHLDTSLFDDDAVFEEIEFVDFYRYVDVDLGELYRFLEDHAPWVRPVDTGRSTNCLVNAAGIYVHRFEQGFHNYALPYSWDVRLGHKTRAEALDELDDDLDEAEVQALLAEIGFAPRPREVLTAWYQAAREIDPAVLRQHLRERLPEHGVPAAFVHLRELPLAASAKIDVSALPAPTRFHRSGAGYVAPTTALAARLCDLWGELLGIERVGVDDDFFDVGGNSLDALEMVARIGHEFGVDVPDTMAFQHRTVREVEALLTGLRGTGPVGSSAADAAAVGHGAAPARAPIPPAAGVPLSAGQEGLLYEVLTYPDSARFAITRRYEVSGTFDTDRFRAALLAVVEAHEPLHWTVGDERRQVDPADALEWRVLPVGTDVERWVESQARRRFDPSRPPLVRASVVEGEPTTVVLSLHHLWCDAGSFDVLWDDLALAYRGEPVPERTVRYSDHGAWQRSQVDDRSRAYWHDLLEGVRAGPVLGLPAPSSSEPDGYLRRPVEVDRRGPSLFATFLTAVDIVLSSYTDDPVVVGVPVTTRDHPEVEGLVGYFLNDVVLALPDARDADVATLAVEVEAVLASALRHRLVPYAEVVADRRRQGRASDLLGVMVVHDVEGSPALPGLTIRSETIPNGTAVTDLSLFVIERGGHLEVAAEWSGRRYRARDIEALLAQVATVLEGGVHRTGGSTTALRGRWGPADLTGPLLPGEVPGVLDEIWARATLAQVAVSYEGQRLLYPDLVARADQVAARLVSHGVRPGDSVALLLPRSVDQVIAILGVLRARAAYVPVDPAHPATRIDAVLSSVSPVLVITEEAAAHRPDRWPFRTIGELQTGGVDDGADLPMPEPDDPAYIIHTSGSTGVPRGVRVRHRQLAASNLARRLHYDREPDRFLWTSSYGFDSSIAGLFWTLTSGGELVLPPPGPAVDVDVLLDRAATSGATHLLTVPSLWSAMLDRGAARLHLLQSVIVAGEACPAGLVARHEGLLPDVALWNEYGPTEVTVWATVQRCTGREDPVPIGRPIAGMLARVTGVDGVVRPTGVSGELWLGGPSVTDGYLDDPDASAARFRVAGDGTRWYRTGDLARRRDDGVLEFLGRVDDQLNLRGVRVEPAEIERAVQAFGGVRAVVVRAEPRVPADIVAALEDLPRDEAADLLRQAGAAARPATDLAERLGTRLGLPPALVAHVEADRLDDAGLRDFLGRRLADHSVPARFVRHDQLPRTVHGKLDRDALPLARAAPTAMDREDDRASLRAGPLANRIVGVWRDLLDDPRIGLDTDYFETDADSLLAVRTVAVLSEVLGVEVTVAALLEARTPRALAAALGPEVERSSLLVPLQQGPDDRRPPLFLLAQYGGHAEAMLASYMPLVSGLGPEVTAIGVRQPEPGLEDETSIERVAEATVGELLVAQPTGPLWVFGASINGLIALEVARLWREAGREVALVGLGDTFFPGEGDRYQRILIVRRLRKYRELLRRGAVRGAGQELIDAFRRRLGLATVDRGTHAPWTGRLGFERELRLSAQTYAPPALPLPVVFYSASATTWSKAGRRWSSALPDLTVVPVRGSHHGRRYFLRADRVGPVSSDLRRRLAD